MESKAAKQFQDTYHQLNYQLLRAQHSTPGDGILAQIRSIHQELKPFLYAYSKDRSFLAPAPHINILFSSLVHICQRLHAAEVVDYVRSSLREQEKAELRAACHHGECEMERYFAKRALNWINADRDHAKALVKKYVKDNLYKVSSSLPLGCQHHYFQVERLLMLEALYSRAGAEPFPYLNNYRDMVQFGDAPLLKNIISHTQSYLAFVGSGSMDITADLLLASFDNIHITCVDMDEQAIAISKELHSFKEEIGVCRVGRKAYVCDKAENYLAKADTTDIVFFAAMISEESIAYALKAMDKKNILPLALLYRDTLGIAASCLYRSSTHSDLTAKRYQNTLSYHPVQHSKDSRVNKKHTNRFVLPSTVINSVVLEYNKN